jgi:hypothetical protein
MRNTLLLETNIAYTVKMGDDTYQELHDTLASCKTRDKLFTAIVNAPFKYRVEMTHLSLGIIVLLLGSSTDGQIHRMALSSTEMADGTKDVSVKRFEDIKIPIDYEHNIIADVIRTQEPRRTTDWQYLFAPALTPEEARLNQAGGSIACSVVYPLRDVGDGGALIFSYYQYPEYLGDAQEEFMETYSQMVANRLRASGAMQLPLHAISAS